MENKLARQVRPDTCMGRMTKAWRTSIQVLIKEENDVICNAEDKRVKASEMYEYLRRQNCGRRILKNRLLWSLKNLVR